MLKELYQSLPVVHIFLITFPIEQLLAVDCLVHPLYSSPCPMKSLERKLKIIISLTISLYNYEQTSEIVKLFLFHIRLYI